MPNIRIMNWNIEQLGQTKIQIVGIPEAIAEIVVAENIDILTILELRTTNNITAQNIMNRLSTACNQKAVYLAAREAALGAGVSLEIARDIAGHLIAPAPGGADLLTVAQAARTTGVNAVMANIVAALPGGIPAAVGVAVNGLAPNAQADPVATAIRASAIAFVPGPPVMHFGALFAIEDIIAAITPVAIAAARATIGLAAGAMPGAVAADPIVTSFLGVGAVLLGGGAAATVASAISLAVERAVATFFAARMVEVMVQGRVTNIGISNAVNEVADMTIPGGPPAGFIAAVGPVARVIVNTVRVAAAAGAIVGPLLGALGGGGVAGAAAAALGGGFAVPGGLSLGEAQALVVTTAVKAAVLHQLGVHRAAGAAIGNGLAAAVAPVALATVTQTTANGGAAPVVAAVTGLYPPLAVPVAVAAALTGGAAVQARVDDAVTNALPNAANIQGRIAQVVGAAIAPVALNGVQTASLALAGGVANAVAGVPIVAEAVARQVVAAAITAAAPAGLTAAKQVAVTAALPGGLVVPAVVVADAVAAADAAALAAEPGGVSLAVAAKIPAAIATLLATPYLNAALPIGGTLAATRTAAITAVIDAALRVGVPPNFDALVMGANGGNPLAVLAEPIIRAAAVAAAGAGAVGGVAAAVTGGGGIGGVAVANGPIAGINGAVNQAVPPGPPVLTLAEGRVAAVKAVVHKAAEHFGAGFTVAESIAALVAPVAVAAAIAAAGALAPAGVAGAVLAAAAPLLGNQTPVVVLAARAMATSVAMGAAGTLIAKREAAVQEAVDTSATNAGLGIGPAAAVANAAADAALAVADAATISNIPALLAKHGPTAQRIATTTLGAVPAGLNVVTERANVVSAAIRHALLALVPTLPGLTATAVANALQPVALAQLGALPAAAAAAFQGGVVNNLTALGPGAAATLVIAGAVVAAVNLAVVPVTLNYTTGCISEPTGTEHYGFLIKDSNIVRPLVPRDRKRVVSDLNLHPFQVNPNEFPAAALPASGNLGVMPLSNLHAASPFTHRPIGFTGQTLNQGGYNQGRGYRLPCLAMFQINAIGNPILPIICCHYAAGRGNAAAIAQIQELWFLHIAQIFNNGGYIELNGRPKIVADVIFTGDFNISFLENVVPIPPRARVQQRTVHAYGRLTPTHAKGGSAVPAAAAGGPAPVPARLPLDAATRLFNNIPPLALRTAVTNVGTILHHYNNGATFLQVASLAGACFDNFFFGGTHLAAPGGPVALPPPPYWPPVANADISAVIDLPHRIDVNTYPATPGRVGVAAIAASYLAPPPGVAAGPHNAGAAPNLQIANAALTPDDRLIGARFISDHLPVIVEYNIP